MRTTTLLKRLTPVLLLPLALPLIASADAPANAAQSKQQAPYRPREQTLIDKVYRDNLKFSDITYARRYGYEDLTTCVSGPEAGAMGIHLVNKKLLFDGVITPHEPEILVYEPLGNNHWRLVAVEFVLPAAAWKPEPDGPATPSVDGNLMFRIDGPNRYGPDSLYTLHVWAFERNPLGAYADWNIRVSCEKQPVDVT